MDERIYGIEVEFGCLPPDADPFLSPDFISVKAKDCIFYREGLGIVDIHYRGRDEPPGNGGFLFNAQEIQTAVDHGINVVAIVMNDNCWGSEKSIQKNRFDGRYWGVDIDNPRFDRYADLFGARGFYCDHPDQVGDVLKEAMDCGKPAVIEVPIEGVAA